ncbi:MAG: hypothetical protein CMO55_25415 [Verrucomicrobiales bacterium]|nr:hypothetical protein [Verrucomicrobiales bacterium]
MQFTFIVGKYLMSRSLQNEDENGDLIAKLLLEDIRNASKQVDAEDFISQIPNLNHVLEVLSLMDDVSIFLKDSRSRYMFGTPCFREKLGADDSSNFILSRDYDFYAPLQAESHIREEKEVRERRKAIHAHPRWHLLLRAGVEWVRVSKFAVNDEAGAVVGVCGLVRTICRFSENAAILANCGQDERLDRAIHWMFQNTDRELENEHIAEEVHVSTRQLGRLFQKEFNTTPQRFLSTIKLDNACRRLRQGVVPIVEIALDLGFGDQSSFTAWFRKSTGLTPRSYRECNGSGTKL